MYIFKEWNTKSRLSYSTAALVQTESNKLDCYVVGLNNHVENESTEKWLGRSMQNNYKNMKVIIHWMKYYCQL